MLTTEQMEAWAESEKAVIAGLERKAEALILACEQVNPLIEKAIGGLGNAGVSVVTYRMALGELRLHLKVLKEHRAAFATAMTASCNRSTE